MLGSSSTTSKKMTTTQTSLASSTVNISNESELLPLLKAYDDEKNTSTQWILLEPQSDHTIKYVTHGEGLFTGAPPGPLADLIDDKKVQYLLMTMPHGSNQYGLFTWIGKDAPQSEVNRSNTEKLSLHKALSAKLHYGTVLQSGELRG